MKKKLIKLVSAVLALSFAVGMTTGCDLIGTDNKKDMEQVVAEVNIGSDSTALNKAFSSFGTTLQDGLADQMDSVLATDEIYKRDLVAYFFTYGYSYISQGYTYADTFETLLDGLVNRKMVTQFATLYYLNEGEVVVDRDNVDSRKGYTEIENSDGLRMNKEISVDGYLKALEGLSGDAATVAAYEYFLTEDEINYSVYQAMVSINGAIDSYEESIIAAEEEEEADSSADRTVPTGANVLSSNYYPQKTEDGEAVIDYGIYTGFNQVSDCGEYEKLEGSTAFTRTRAYARFINSLRQNHLVSDDAKNVFDIQSLGYFDLELKTQLEQQLITKFSATLSLDMSDSLEKGALELAYEMLLQQQSVSTSGFTSTMDSVSDTSFVLYSPENRTYGFVYNILLPFNANQNLVVSELSALYGAGTKEYYAARNTDGELYQNIEATDQRSSWFNGATDYSFDATEYDYKEYYPNSGSSYLFFKDSYITAQSDRGTEKGIDRYAGQYAYNGTVEVKDDGTYRLTPNKLKIDDFIAEMEGYINYMAGSDVASGSYYSGNHTWDAENGNAFYAVTPADFLDENNQLDYSASIYYKGTVNGVKNVDPANYLVKDQISYRVLSAVNELMFAYSTDTGCLNTYYGYSIESFESATSYVAEFEYAAQDIIRNDGVGSYAVVATDYGWHIIYVSFVYDGGAVYSQGFVYADRNKEGTFSYYFYQAKKDEVAADFATNRQNEVLTMLDSESNVSRYPNRYKDLSNLDA